MAIRMEIEKAFADIDEALEDHHARLAALEEKARRGDAGCPVTVEDWVRELLRMTERGRLPKDVIRFGIGQPDSAVEALVDDIGPYIGDAPIEESEAKGGSIVRRCRIGKVEYADVKAAREEHARAAEQD